ncbi:MAG TPA: transglycosylase domain-containing protein [Mycobacteriales bacterium]|nr:transglycosylase domain-containing protein [Mycobacteriales bacterium]
MTDDDPAPRSLATDLLAGGVRDAASGTAKAVAAVGVCLLAGMLVAGLTVPLVGGIGIAAKASADEFLELPAEFEPPTPAQRTTVLARTGQVIAYLYLQNRVPVTLDPVPPHVRDAVIAVEDERFYEHNGIDVKGSLRAAVENATSRAVRQGGSTLTQQYVKNALVASASTQEQVEQATEQSLERKLREARLALALERRMSKDEILQRYLNLAYFGNGVYGIGTAASFYFSKPVEELTVAEGALLAGLVQRPATYDPLRNLTGAVYRRDVVLRRMHDAGFLDGAGLVAALDEAPDLRPAPVGSGCEAPGVGAPFFCDYVRRALEEGPLGAALGTTREERQQRLLTGGYTIRTTLDPRMQDIAQRQLNLAVPPTDPSGVAAVYTSVRPGSGEVEVLAVNRRFGEDRVPGATKLNLALGGSSGMQAGSTFKPFVLAAALEQGVPLHYTLDAPAEYESAVFANCDGRTCDNPYVVRNAGDSNAGRHDLVSATHSSVNTYYVQLEERTGVERPAQIAEALGLRQFQDGDPTAPLHRGGSFVLGVNEISPLQLSAAYAAFAAHGEYCPPRPVTGITDARGRPVPLPPQECRQVLQPQIADTVTSILRGNVDGPWPRTGRLASIGRPAAGKTGSTNGSKAAWFAGYTPRLAASVWIGTPQPTELRQVTIHGRYYRQVYGGTLPAPIWASITGPAVAPAAPEPMPPAVAPAPGPPPPETRRDDDRRAGSVQQLARGRR